MANMEITYTYKEVGTGEDAGRLLTPWADPHVYEYPFDFCWDTPEEARAFLQDSVEQEQVDREEASGWVLVKETLEVFAPAIEGIEFPESGE